ncbi:MAG: hypothetical protein KDC79_17405 [Cyclobacteriaceae bacterium]|nr:hypothetical protein [Cyclobacteriaceae bacterium]
MISLTSLWLPILVSAVFVFILSSLLHMLLTYHNSDFKGLQKEKEVMDALRPLDLPEGEYVFPFAKDNKERQTDEYKEKLNKGPVAFINIFPNGQISMGASLIQWFLYSLLVGLFSGYVAAEALITNSDYLSVFRFVGTTAFMGYSFALLQNSIWYKRPWSTTLKSVFDGLIYALVTAGTFGWLWP